MYKYEHFVIYIFGFTTQIMETPKTTIPTIPLTLTLIPVTTPHPVLFYLT